MTPDQTLRLLGLLTDTVSAQAAEIDRLQAELMKRPDPTAATTGPGLDDHLNRGEATTHDGT